VLPQRSASKCGPSGPAQVASRPPVTHGQKVAENAILSQVRVMRSAVLPNRREVRGDTFKRKLVRLAGPSLSNKKITARILEDIDASIQKCLFMLLLPFTIPVIAPAGRRQRDAGNATARADPRRCLLRRRAAL